MYDQKLFAGCWGHEIRTGSVNHGGQKRVFLKRQPQLMQRGAVVRLVTWGRYGTLIKAVVVATRQQRRGRDVLGGQTVSGHST